MNETARLRLPALISLILILFSGACRGTEESPPLEGARLGGPFTLTSHEGRRVSNADFEGDYRLVYFGFTHCPDVCPTDLQTISAALRRFEESDPERAARVQPIFITTDPARDTPEVMREYVSAFHPRLIGLTGSEEEIAQAARSHGVFYSKDGDGPNYQVNHSRSTVLYGPSGEPISILPHDEGPDAVAAQLDRWVR